MDNDRVVDTVSHLVDPELPVVRVQPQLPVVIEPIDSSGDDLQDDYELARKHLRETVERASEALSGILQVAKESDHPRAFEVAGQLLNVVGEAAKNLMELQKRKRDMTGETPQTSTGDTNIENAVFVGTTQELAEIMRRPSRERLPNVE